MFYESYSHVGEITVPKLRAMVFTIPWHDQNSVLTLKERSRLKLRWSAQSVVGGAISGAPDMLFNSFSIGRPGLFDGQYFNGTIDDVRIYNRALSASEVQALYHLGAANVAHSNITALSSGSVGYWTFDGGTTHWNTGKVDDVSGQGNTGQLINMSTTTSPVAGKIGGALKFNGSTSYVSEGTSISNIQSVAFWAKATTGVSQGLINLTGSSVYISTNASGVISGTGFTSPTYYVDGLASTTPGLYDANWHRIVVTGTAAITGSQMEVGRANGVYFGGILDDVRVYNRALSASEVQELYNMGRVRL